MKIYKAIQWHIFIKKSLEIFENYKTSRSFINYIYSLPYPDNLEKSKFLKNISVFEDEYIWYCRETKIYPKFDYIIVNIKELYEEYKNNISSSRPKYKINFKKNKIISSYSDFARYDLSKRKKLGYKWTRKEEMLACIKYNTLHMMTPGNQWTMIMDSEMQILKKLGYIIEIFGSPFNTRLPYFGSLYESDEPFGRVGTCWEILDTLIAGKDILWRGENIFANRDIKIVISPPSGDELLTLLCEKTLKLLDSRSITINMGMPAKTPKYFNILSKSKYFVSSIIKDKSWSYETNELVDMKGREWYGFILKS